VDEPRVQTGGAGQPTLVLLHGLGATSDVWAGWADTLEEHWPGRWLAADLPGHGGSPPLPRYSFGGFAAAIAGLLEPDDEVSVIGHSLGGVVGLALASGWFGVQVRSVVGLGIKVAWTQDELAKAASLAARPTAWFGSRAEAIERHLRVSGLAGLIDADDERLAYGVREHEGQWRLALDSAAFGVGAPDLSGLLAASRADVVLARGEHDPMVTTAQLAALTPTAVELPGLGHNAQVEDPYSVFELLSR
jgi:pimeloyl-ACP methyl ester carboxylesterase